MIVSIAEHQIGLLGAVSPVSLFFVTPIMCAFAEKYGVQQKVRWTAYSDPFENKSCYCMNTELKIHLYRLNWPNRVHRPAPKVEVAY